MRDFAESCADESIVKQLVSQLPCGHTFTFSRKSNWLVRVNGHLHVLYVNHKMRFINHGFAEEEGLAVRLEQVDKVLFHGKGNVIFEPFVSPLRSRM